MYFLKPKNSFYRKQYAERCGFEQQQPNVHPPPGASNPTPLPPPRPPTTSTSTSPPLLHHLPTHIPPPAASIPPPNIRPRITNHPPTTPHLTRQIHIRPHLLRPARGVQIAIIPALAHADEGARSSPYAGAITVAGAGREGTVRLWLVLLALELGRGWGWRVHF